MKKNRTGLALAALLSAALIGGCEASSLGILDGKEGQTPPSAAADPTPGREPSASETTAATTQESDDEKKPVNRPTLEETIQTVDGVPTVTNPNEYHVIVNKQRALPADYIPADLIEPNVLFPYADKVEKRKLREVPAKALESLFAHAKQDGIELYAVSGYRSYRTQKSLYDTYVKTQGEAHAAAFSAVPGKSEHQTGLAMDVSGADSVTRLEQSFADTPEGQWLEKNCAQHGFIIRYPKGKEGITGYAYEPWHLRYVGQEIAEEITSRGITLEEYFSNSSSS